MQSNKQQNGVLKRFLGAVEQTGDIALRYQYQKDMMLNNILPEQEIDLIADRVLSRISATVDVSEIIQKIEELDKMIKNLGQ